jgi:hypothetical protein
MRGLRRSIPVRVLIVALCAQLVALPVWSGAARAAEMMLMEESHPDSNRYAWLWLGLGLISFGVAANDYDESQSNIKKAKSAYTNYQASKSQADALAWRDQTTTFSHRAQSYESTANAAIGIGVLFIVAAIATFRSTGPDDTPMLLSERGVELRIRF